MSDEKVATGASHDQADGYEAPAPAAEPEKPIYLAIRVFRIVVCSVLAGLLLNTAANVSEQNQCYYYLGQYVKTPFRPQDASKLNDKQVINVT